jgi:hypothetical protein
MSGGTANPPPGSTSEIPLDRVTLVELCESERFFGLDRNESYLHAVQDMAKRYDWDGNIVSDDAAPIAPGWVVPMAQRRPCARYDLSKVIVSRFTAMLFGTDRFPELTVPGDPDQEEFIKGILDATRLPLRMIEARNIGGSQGSVGVSFAFIDGKPKLEVHKAKHCTILDWRDRSELRPSCVLKAYKYPRRVFDPESGKLKLVDFFYARLWTEVDETTWEPIPANVAASKAWANSPRTVTVHALNSCPFYWAQNLPNDEDEDGISDYAGLLDNLDEMNRLMSAGVRAVKANSDPTFVVKEDPALKVEHLRKGQGSAIFSRGGAEYVVLPAHTVDSITRTKEDLRHATLDVASVIVADPEKLSGAAQSAAALRLLYAPMTAQADIYREQYGEMLIRPLLRGMIEAVISLEARGLAVVLPKRVLMESDGTVKLLDRVRGDSLDLALNWNPYFAPTWTDIKAAAEAVKSANGGKQVISQRTSIAAVQSLFGVDNVDDEMQAIQAEAEQAIATAQKAFAEGPQAAPLDTRGPNPPPRNGFEDTVGDDDEDGPDSVAPVTSEAANREE